MLVALQVLAQPQQGQVNTNELYQYLRLAGEHNPELKASFSRYLAAMEKVPQVGSLPDPQLTAGYFTMPMEFSLMGNQRAELSLMQMFPWFGMLRTQKDEATLMARGEYESFREVKNRVYFEVKETWYQLHRLEEEIKITQQNLELMRSLERFTLVRFQSGGAATGASQPAPRSQPAPAQGSNGSGMGSMGGGGQAPAQGRSGNAGMGTMGGGDAMGGGGSGSMADVLRVQIEIKEMEKSLADLEDSRRPLLARFNQLLNRDAAEGVTVGDSLLPVYLPENQLAMADSIIQNNPMLRMLASEKEAFQAQERMARLEGRPMFGAGVNYMIFSPRPDADMGGMNMGGKNMIMPMVSVTLPIYRKKYSAMQKEAGLRRDAVAYQQESVSRQLLVQWEEAQRDYRATQRSIRLYREQSMLTQQTLNLLMSGYTAEGRGFDELLRVQQQLLDYRLRLVNSVAEQNTIVAMIEMLAAQGLD
jgi:outer membrane protein TolC